jgi:hypothetical protein
MEITFGICQEACSNLEMSSIPVSALLRSDIPVSPKAPLVQLGIVHDSFRSCDLVIVSKHTHPGIPVPTLIYFLSRSETSCSVGSCKCGGTRSLLGHLEYPAVSELSYATALHCITTSSPRLSSPTYLLNQFVSL